MSRFAWILLALLPSRVCAQEMQLVLDQPLTFTINADSQFGGAIVLGEPSMPTQPTRLLQMPAVLDDLELVPDQRTKLATRLASLRSDMQKREQQLSKTLEGSPELGARIEENRKNFRDACKAATEEILLPFQLERLNQIRLQSELRNGGSRAADSEAFAQLLELSPQQKEELQKKAAEAEEKLRLEIQELKQKRHRQVLEDVLTDKQLKSLDDALGKPFARSPK